MINAHLKLCGTSANNSTFPLFCRQQSNFEACLLIDKESGEAWADTCKKNSWSESEFKGTRKRIAICQNFVDDNEIAEFIESIKGDIDELLQDWDDNGDYIKHRIQEKTYNFRGNKDKIVCCCFEEYAEACELGKRDVLEEIKDFGSLTEYADNLLDNPIDIYFLELVDRETLIDDIVEFIK